MYRFSFIISSENYAGHHNSYCVPYCTITEEIRIFLQNCFIGDFHDSEQRHHWKSQSSKLMGCLNNATISQILCRICSFQINYTKYILKTSFTGGGDNYKVLYFAHLCTRYFENYSHSSQQPFRYSAVRNLHKAFAL